MTSPARTRGGRRPTVTPRLTLDVALVGDNLRVSLTSNDLTVAPIRTCEVRAFDAERVRQLQSEMTALLNRASRWGALEGGATDLLERHGQLLFDEVLPPGLKTSLRAVRDAELTLVLDDALVPVPWEWMHTGEHFLGRELAVGRLVRSERPVLGEPRPRPNGRRKLLVLCDPRGDLLGSYYEGLTLRDALEPHAHRLGTDLRSTEVDRLEIKRLLREYDFVHYAGHAELVPSDPDASGWLVHDGVLSAQDVVDLAGGRPFPAAVFVNACRSGRVDGPLTGGGDAEAVYGLANAFLMGGVSHYIGTLWDVPDEAAAHFSLAFYEALIEGETYGASMRLARIALAARYGDDSILWASYVLYGDPSNAAFRRPHRPSAARRRSPPRAEPAARRGPRSRKPGKPPRPRAIRGAGASDRGMVAADPPFEMAGALTRRLLAALTVLTAISLTVVLTLLASRAPRNTPPGPEVRQRVFVADVAVPEIFPAPPRDTAMPPSGSPPAAVAPGDRPMGADLEVVIQRPDEDGRYLEETIEARGVARSWDNFKLRYHIGQPAWVALWHVESQGQIRRILPSEPKLGAQYVQQVGWTELPGNDRWFYLDDRRGDELFVLTVSTERPAADPAFTDGLQRSERQLAKARRPATQAERLVLRGIGGTRDKPEPAATDSGAIVDQILARFRSNFEHVQVVHLEHR